MDRSAPTLGPVAAAALVQASRLLGASWRWQLDNPQVFERALEPGPAVLALWHGDLLPMILAHAGRGLVGLTSLSDDGAIVAGVLARLGYRVVRGSSSRGGAEALRACQRLMEDAGASPIFAVDGPRGPAGTVHPGAALLAARTGRPIIFGVCRATPARRLRSWDRFAIPAPFARVRVRYGRLPAPAPGHEEDTRRALEEQMRAATATLLRGGS